MIPQITGGQTSFFAAGWSREGDGVNKKTSRSSKKSIAKFSSDVPSGEEYFVTDTA